jgi:hypothetical protein
LFKLVLTFAKTVIPGLGFLEMHGQDIDSPLGMYVLQNGTSYSTKEGLSSYAGATFDAP